MSSLLDKPGKPRNDSSDRPGKVSSAKAVFCTAPIIRGLIGGRREKDKVKNK